jgi:hypothetical protein
MVQLRARNIVLVADILLCYGILTIQAFSLSPVYIQRQGRDSHEHHSRPTGFSMAFRVAPHPSSLRAKGNANEEPSSAVRTKDDATSDESSEDLPTWVQAILKWPLRPSSLEEKATTSTAKEIASDTKVLQGSSTTDNARSSSSKINNPTEAAHDGWLMDPIFRSIFNMQDLLPTSSSSRNETRNFLDLMDDPSESGLTSTSSQMEAILDSLEGAAILLNVSEAATGALESTSGWNRWDRWVGSMQQALARQSSANLTAAAEGILRQATARIEGVLTEAALPASTTLQALLDAISANATAVAAQAAVGRSLDINEAMERASELGNQLKGVGEGLLRQGYVSKKTKKTTATEKLADKTSTAGNRTLEKSTVAKPKTVPGRKGALFEDFQSASELKKYTPLLGQAAEMGALSGVIYEEVIPRSLQLGHSVVATGISAHVKWLVTDSIASHSEIELVNDRIDNDRSESPLLIRTITIRGYDTGDEDVDREELVIQICTANPEKLDKYEVKVHSGLMKIARAIYKDVVDYIDWTTPQHKIVLTGHSIGGSVAQLLLILLTMEKGADWVEEHVLRVYTFGAPPVLETYGSERKTPRARLHCDVLEAFGLPTNLVWAFVQPWDPICRLFSESDCLYPLIGDMGPESDGITPWPEGPP